MNPLVWRFMGGATVATAVDLVIPGYSRILFAGLGAALPEGSKKTGVRKGMQKGFEVIGKAEWKVLSSPKYFGRFAVRTIPKLGLRIIPVIGWAWLAYDVAGFYPGGQYQFMLDSTRQATEDFGFQAGGRTPYF